MQRRSQPHQNRRDFAHSTWEAAGHPGLHPRDPSAGASLASGRWEHRRVRDGPWAIKESPQIESLL